LLLILLQISFLSIIFHARVNTASANFSVLEHIVAAAFSLLARPFSSQFEGFMTAIMQISWMGFHRGLGQEAT
jgi:hypothetical protein